MAFSKNNSRKPPRNHPERRKANRKRHGKRTIHHVILIILILGAGIILSLTVFFKIESISIFGNEHYDNNDIAAVTGLEVGENLFLADTSSVADKIKASFPYVEDVEVRRAFPPSIRIDLTSSVPIAALQQGDEFSLITMSGKVLEKGLVLIPSDVILVKGIHFEEYQPGQYLGTYEPDKYPDDASDKLTKQITERNLQMKEQAESELDALSVIFYLLEAIDIADFHGISNLDLSDPLNMNVVFENRLILKLGTEYELSYKLRFIKDVVAELDPDAHGIIRAENAKQSSRIVFTPAEGYDSSGKLISSSLEISDIEDEDVTYSDEEKEFLDEGTEVTEPLEPEAPEVVVSDKESSEEIDGNPDFLDDDEDVLDE